MAQAVVGLGNPGPEYRGTRHNVGQRVVDHLAKSLRKRWSREGPSQVVRGRWRGEALFLIKPAGFMNVTGPALARLLSRLGLAPADLILVYDDLDLPLGKVRVRMKGSHGGHKGVRSVIETLGTDQLRRVKVGIGRPEGKDAVVDHVLSPFLPDELPRVEAACAEAALHVLTLVESQHRPDR
ncbi:MAG: aminoacyl-tRNA hydrolase [Candidatus Rokubacteria bacterium]|nr:aminoacyl-tRNA hydrolase [Candidatus Rokubacteria bacterium]